MAERRECDGNHPTRMPKKGPWTEDQCRLCWEKLNRGLPLAPQPPVCPYLSRRVRDAQGQVLQRACKTSG